LIFFKVKQRKLSLFYFDFFLDTCQSPSASERNDISKFQTSTSVVFEQNIISNPFELDDPVVFRQQILDHHRHREQTKHEQDH
jgi:hypothetical protein